MTFEPMLARSATLSPAEIEGLRFPVVASPKLDGMRVIKRGGSAMTRNMKPVANVATRLWLERWLPNDIDGELCLPKLTEPLEQVMSAFRSIDGSPEFKFAAFDWFGDEAVPFHERLKMLGKIIADRSVAEFNNRIIILRQTLVQDVVALRFVIEQHLEQGFEGTMVRRADMPYKQGRSTYKEGGLLKIKPFEDEEATIIGFVEEMENTNEELTAIGRRSTAKAGLVAKGRLGAFRCAFVSDGTEFTVGGFTDVQKASYWLQQEQLLGKIGTVKHQIVHGGRRVGQAPRHPQWKGFRPEQV